MSTRYDSICTSLCMLTSIVFTFMEIRILIIYYNDISLIGYFIALSTICVINIFFTIYVFHKWYGDKLHVSTQILMSLPFISITHSFWMNLCKTCQDSSSFVSLLLNINNNDWSIIYQWRLDMMEKHIGMTSFAISNVFWAVIIIMVKIIQFSIKSEKLTIQIDEFIACLFGISFLSIIIIKQFHSINKLIIFWNWISWLIEFITISIIIIYLFQLWLSSKSIFILILYIISMLQYLVYWVGIFLCIYQDIYCNIMRSNGNTSNTPFLVINDCLCFGWLFLYCCWLYPAQINHDNIICKFMYRYTRNQQVDDFWYNISNWIISSVDRDKICIHRKICCIMDFLWNKVVENDDNKIIETYFYDSLYANVTRYELCHLFDNDNDEEIKNVSFLATVFWEFPFQKLLTKLYQMIKDSPQDCNFSGVIFPALLFIFVAIIEIIYILSRLVIILIPVYGLIKYDHYLLPVLSAIYLVLVIIWIYLFIKDIYCMSYALWYMFCGEWRICLDSYDDNDDYLSDKKIIEFYDAILQCEMREKLVLKYCDNDIGSIINNIIGREYIRLY